MSETWTKGKELGCVVSDTPNRHSLADDHVEYYGGYLVAESIPKQEYVNLIAAAPDLLSVAVGVIAALAYPRGSEAQVRCLEEVGQQAEAAIAKARGE